MMAYRGMGVWVLEKRGECGWEFCDVFGDKAVAERNAHNYHGARADIRWTGNGFASSGFFGEASVPAFRVELKAIK